MTLTDNELRRLIASLSESVASGVRNGGTRQSIERQLNRLLELAHEIPDPPPPPAWAQNQYVNSGIIP